MNDEMIEHFAGQKVLYLATAPTENDEFPSVRPVTVFLTDGELYFVTSTSSRKVAALRAVPRMALCLPVTGDQCHGYVHIQAWAEFIQGPEEQLAIVQRAGFGEVVARHFGEGPIDPDCLLIKIIPERVEYLKPGESEAIEVSW